MAEKALFTENLVDTEAIREKKKISVRPKGRSKIRTLENCIFFTSDMSFTSQALSVSTNGVAHSLIPPLPSPPILSNQGWLSTG